MDANDKQVAKIILIVLGGVVSFFVGLFYFIGSSFDVPRVASEDPNSPDNPCYYVNTDSVKVLIIGLYNCEKSVEKLIDSGWTLKEIERNKYFLIK